MRGIIKEDVPYQPLPHADYARQPFRQTASVGVLKDETLVAGEKEIGGQQLLYIFHKARCRRATDQADHLADHCADQFQFKRKGSIDVLNPIDQSAFCAWRVEARRL